MGLYRAVLLGTAVGDALGVPYEGSRPRSDLALRGRIVSDDTELTALVAHSLARHRDDREGCVRALRRALLGWLLRLPWGVGWGTLRACVRIALGLTKSGVRSAGNGAAMRAAIVGAFFRHRSRDERIAWIDAISEVTHVDPRAVQGARFVAELAACRDARRALEVVDDASMRAALERALAFVEEGVTTSRAIEVLGTSGFVVESVPFAVFCALRYEPPRALHEAVLGGGDTDTNAAIAGALAGAIHGDHWIEPRLFPGPFGTAHLEALARDLEEGTADARFSWPLALARNVVTFPIVALQALRWRR